MAKGRGGRGRGEGRGERDGGIREKAFMEKRALWRKGLKGKRAFMEKRPLWRKKGRAGGPLRAPRLSSFWIASPREPGRPFSLDFSL
jgi:hypothetical protein